MVAASVRWTNGRLGNEASGDWNTGSGTMALERKGGGAEFEERQRAAKKVVPKS
jgi:hypothetical protein